ncbi:hypothetical protein BG006_002689, partial [Podila minutissima]
MALTRMQQVHLSNHAGYSLLRPQDFLEKYGDYVLRVLQMVKHGCLISLYKIPPLDPRKILWRCDPNIIGKHLTEDTISSLVDKAITYIQDFSPPKWIMEPGLTRIQSAVIKSFLNVQEGENTEGNLHRYINSDQRVSWKCQVHKQQGLDQKSLAALQKFVCDHGGHVDMQQAVIRVNLRSTNEADQFWTLLRGTQQIFNISLKLSWKAVRSYLYDLTLDVARSKAVVLEIDGVTLESYPQGFMQYSHDLITKVITDSDIQLVILVNYPRPQELCLHFGRFSVQSAFTVPQLNCSWVELRTELQNFGNLVSLAHVASDLDTAVETLQSVLEKHGYPKTTVVTIHESTWSAVFNLEKGGVVEAYLQDDDCPKGVLASGSLRKLSMDATRLELYSGFHNMGQTRAGLQELHIAHYENLSFKSNLLDIVQSFADLQELHISHHEDVELNNNSITRQTFTDLQESHLPCYGNLNFNNNFFHMAQTLAGLQKIHISYYGDLEFNNNFFCMVQALNLAGLQKIHISHYGDMDFSNNSSHMANINASLQELKIWSRGYNVVYNIEHIFKIWHESTSTFHLTLLDHLKDNQGRVVAQLGVQGRVGKFPGNNTTSDQGSDTNASSHQNDWTIPVGIEFLQWDCDHSFSQLSDYSASFLDMATQQHPLALTMFTLDISRLTGIGLSSVKYIFGRSNLECLQIVCTPVAPNIYDSLSQVLHSVQWSTLKYLVLCGDNIDEWIKL